MLFVLEGLDRTGKTTLAKEGLRLALKHPYYSHESGKYLHFSAPQRHPVEEYMRPLLGYDPRLAEDWWVDRHYLGELVWPKFFGRKTQFDRPMATFIELFLLSRGVVPIYCWRPPTELFEACKNEPIHNREMEAHRAFKGVTEKSWLEWQNYCQDRTPVRSLTDLGEITQEEAAEPFLATWRWIGSPAPRYLLVGEQVNQPRESAGLPFIPYAGRSGHYLMTALNTYVLRGKPVALANAVTPEGEDESLRDLWVLLGEPRVVALGKTAERTLDRLGLEHGSTYHPQYWKRFKTRLGVDAYAKLIKEEAQL